MDMDTYCRYLPVLDLLEIVVVCGVGGFDEVTFVGDVHRAWFGIFVRLPP